MKILFGIRGYYPSVKHGGPPISVQNLCELIGNDNECFVVTTNHDKDSAEVHKNIKSGWNKVGKAKVIYLSDADTNYNNMKKIACEIKPDLICIQSLFDFAYTVNLLRVAKELHIPTVLSVRGELSKTIMKKKYKKIPYIYFLKISGLLNGIHFHGTFDEEGQAIQHFLCNNSKRISVIENVPVSQGAKKHTTEKEKGKLKVVFISRIVENKNLKGALQAIGNAQGDILFDIYGFKQDVSYWEECASFIKALTSNIKVEYKGELKHEQVSSTLAEYDVFLFPTYSENYGQIIAEALLTGVPVIIGDNTPWKDVSDFGAGWALPIENIGDYTAAINKMCQMDTQEYNRMREKVDQYISKKVDMEALRDKYNKYFEELVQMKE